MLNILPEYDIVVLSVGILPPPKKIKGHIYTMTYMGASEIFFKVCND